LDVPQPLTSSLHVRSMLKASRTVSIRMSFSARSSVIRVAK
jgi:hypothetical protein